MRSMTPAQSAVALAIAEAGGPAVVAALVGKSVQAVCFWRDGDRNFPVELCAALEAAQTKVSRRQMRPEDWHLIWPELVTAEHPAPVREAA
jgi:DNA-binding transcriptional regulator YdaS (Cro superfamily)